MKKLMLALALTSVATFAADTTITATMQLMEKGMEQVQKGFMYNSKQDIMQGIETLQNSDAIFKKVDVTTFIPNNKKVRVTQNITDNLGEDLVILKKAIENNEFTTATEKYGKVLNDCVACHTTIRGW
ncbi:cytochrome C [Sulfurimonas sp. C5]|uniref:cytochrome C n=1 Tax=Sulfurimonas sp. C5 TaxID=3036947 RepID=UPI002455781D|nr:cytochrome C [Sulfurimonas sp. C5]MDH4944477.1 cytochrome C [Sulfurimonas sp. C5]